MIFILRRVEQVGQPRVGLHFVRGERQRRQLLNSGSRATGRHQYRHIPVQHAGSLAERGHPLKAAFKFLIS